MTRVIDGRMTAGHDGDLAVFLIGARANRLWQVHKWWPVVRAMTAMLGELFPDADSGFLGAETMLRPPRTVMLVQYWRSFEHLHAYAHDPARAHQPAWRTFNRAIGGDGSVGIFHETYLVPAGGHETMYVNMPPFGLGKVAGVVAATGKRAAARDRLRAGAVQAASDAASVAAIQPPPSTRSPA